MVVAVACCWWSAVGLRLLCWLACCVSVGVVGLICVTFGGGFDGCVGFALLLFVFGVCG